MFDDRQQQWRRAARLCISNLFDRVERAEAILGISPKAMHERIARLEAQASQAPHASQPSALKDDDPPKRFADSRSRVWIGARGCGMTIDEAKARAAELRAETAPLRAPRAGKVHHLRKVG